MRLVGIGDLFIPCSYIEQGFASLAPLGVTVETVEWRLEDFDQLQEVNLKIEQAGSDAVEPPDYVAEALRDARIVVTHFCPVTAGLLDRCPQVKVVGVLRGGCENVNVDHARRKGILVFNTPGRNADAVADFTVGVMIAECRNIAKGHHGLKQGQWIRRYPNYRTIPDMPGRTVGLIGLGEIGRKVARRLVGFDVEILGCDPYVSAAAARRSGARLVELDELLRSSDFVSLHARLTQANRKMIGRRELGLMKPTAYLVNTARAHLVDEDALHEALAAGRIAGAAIDVFEAEPPGIDHPLVRLANITVTPHMAGGSVDAFINSPRRLAADMAHLFGDPSEIRFLLNPEALAAWRA